MKTVITGAGGQLGRELQSTCPPGIDMLPCSFDELDITDANQVEIRLAELCPEVIINAAAYTAVDGAEQDRERAFAVNAKGAGRLARVATAIGARLIQISTDFVFSGEHNRPYSPTARAEPLGAYGASKLAGEQQVLEATSGRALVIRTAWVYSRFGHNFVKTMLQLLTDRPQLTVVSDQIGTPTWAHGLAQVIWAASVQHDLAGVFHWTDAGVASWYDFAIAIQDEAAHLGLLNTDCLVGPIATEDYPTPARRPRFSVLDTTATCRDLKITPTHWRHQLRSMLRDLHQHGED